LTATTNPLTQTLEGANPPMADYISEDFLQVLDVYFLLFIIFRNIGKSAKRKDVS
jgi:hypothetical protein